MRVTCFTVAALLGTLIPVLADDAPPGKVVIARASGDATVLYDATPEVAAIVRDKLSDDAANARLQRDALRVLAKVAPELTDAQTITVRITYAQSGDVSPVYGTPTFAGVERYANLKSPAADAKSDRDKWKEGLAGTAPPPAWITFTVVGKLPPR